ncbi:hypothetical protein [Salinactinospora qingdaonensis]|uniref:Uncharacterized protein n=1 Tax=Salinactinospora qingdaonensis TaxID=702744 RepID=A0ABP7FWT6_9ACTN
MGAGRIPDYARFAELAENHTDCWQVGYDYDSTLPYRACDHRGLAAVESEPHTGGRTDTEEDRS